MVVSAGILIFWCTMSLENVLEVEVERAGICSTEMEQGVHIALQPDYIHLQGLNLAATLIHTCIGLGEHLLQLQLTDQLRWPLHFQLFAVNHTQGCSATAHKRIHNKTGGLNESSFLILGGHNCILSISIT